LTHEALLDLMHVAKGLKREARQLRKTLRKMKISQPGSGSGETGKSR